jgi:biopolymer transport protein ExbD
MSKHNRYRPYTPVARNQEEAGTSRAAVNLRTQRGVTIGEAGPVPVTVRLACYAQASGGQALEVRGRRRPRPAQGAKMKICRSICGHETSKCRVRMTPMIDIVFLLIISFMCVSELGKLEAEALTLPEAMAAAPDDRGPCRLTVNLMRDGTCRVGGQTCDGSTLRTLIDRRANGTPRDSDGNPDLVVRIRADAEVPYRYVQRVMVYCREAAVRRLSFGVAPLGSH